MAFQSIPGIEGKVFVPDKGCRAAKHPCRECYACQQCSDDRCRVCRRDDPAACGDATEGRGRPRCGNDLKMACR